MLFLAKNDLTDQIPDESEVQLPVLPLQPDSSTTVAPTRRLRQKVTFNPATI